MLPIRLSEGNYISSIVEGRKNTFFTLHNKDGRSVEKVSLSNEAFNVLQKEKCINFDGLLNQFNEKYISSEDYSGVVVSKNITEKVYDSVDGERFGVQLMYPIVDGEKASTQKAKENCGNWMEAFKYFLDTELLKSIGTGLENNNIEILEETEFVFDTLNESVSLSKEIYFK